MVLSLLLLIFLGLGIHKIANDARNRAIENGAVTEEEAKEVDGDKALLYTIFNLMYWRNISGQK